MVQLPAWDNQQISKVMPSYYKYVSENWLFLGYPACLLEASTAQSLAPLLKFLVDAFLPGNHSSRENGGNGR